MRKAPDHKGIWELPPVSARGFGKSSFPDRKMHTFAHLHGSLSHFEEPTGSSPEKYSIILMGILSVPLEYSPKL